MLWGAGEIPVKILPTFTPSCDYGIKWGRALNGSSYRIDRGYESDVHSCAFKVAGEASMVLAAYDAIAGTDATSVGNVFAQHGEWIFGPATHAPTGSGYELLVESVGKLERTGLNTLAFDVTVSGVVLYDPAYTAALPASFTPALSHSTETSVGTAIAKPYNFSGGDVLVSKVPTSFAEFTFSQVMKKDVAAAFQMYFETVNRGAVILSAAAPAIIGVDYPFGPQYSYPCDVIIRDVSFEPYTPNYWRVNVIMQKA